MYIQLLLVGSKLKRGREPMKLIATSHFLIRGVGSKIVNIKSIFKLKAQQRFVDLCVCREELILFVGAVFHSNLML